MLVYALTKTAGATRTRGCNDEATATLRNNVNNPGQSNQHERNCCEGTQKGGNTRESSPAAHADAFVRSRKNCRKCAYGSRDGMGVGLNNAESKLDSKQVKNNVNGCGALYKNEVQVKTQQQQQQQQQQQRKLHGVSSASPEIRSMPDEKEGNAAK